MAKVSKRRGRYVLDFYDHEGNRKWQTMPKGTTKKAAQEELNNILDRLKLGNYVPNQKIPTFKEMAQEWLAHKKLNIRSSTWSVYEGHTRNHFNEFDHLKISQISTKMIEEYIKARQDQGMNLSTLKKILISMGQIFSLATKRGYCVKNPLIDADRPRNQGTVEEETDKMQILTPDQIATFLGAVKVQKYKTLFNLAIFSGARQGELLGLKWSDILWHDGQIYIQRSFNNGEFYATKTKESKRKIDIGPATMKMLKEWKPACPPSRHDLVFPTEAGNPMNHNNMVNRHFRPSLNAAGLNRIRFHDLRHTYASLLIEQGENIKYVQTQLGHSNPTVTLNVYAHLMKPTNRASAIKLEQAIFN
jgi:integrase